MVLDHTTKVSLFSRASIFRQRDDASVEMDQIQYLEKIHPLHILRERRVNPECPLSPEKVHELRRLNGNLQHAAAHTWPDIAAKVGFTKGRVQHLLEANRVLHGAKSHAASIMVAQAREEHVIFCTFSDASFASTKDNNSY